MSEMIKRVAEAISEAASEADSVISVEDAVRFAKVAVAALRDPTKEMVVAGNDEKDACIDKDYDSDRDGNWYISTTISSDLPTRVFRSMVDAALEDGGTD